MELRIAFTTALALFGAAAAVPACELLESEPLFCAPKIEGGGPAADPQCTSCIEDQCGNAGENCAGECQAYGECTCECDENDAACFDLCADQKNDECRACEDANANAVLACVMEKCQVCGGEAPSESSAEGNADAAEDTGDPSWSESGAGEETGAWSETGGGGAACDELHTQCCPNLEGFDLELCETATDEGSCQLWLEIFQEEGTC